MKHEKYKEMILLYSINELTKKETNDLAKHILVCPECQKEMKNMKIFVQSIRENKPKNISQILSETIKEELAERKKHKAVKVTQPITLINKIKHLFKSRFVLQGAFSLALGIFLGFLIFSNTPKLFDNTNDISLDDISKNKISVSNISYQENGSNIGDVIITYESQRPFQHKGNLNDERTKQLIASAILNASNPGLKIKTINTISEQTDKVIILDKKIKNALITALKTDENAGVRKQALNALTKYPYDEEIRDALLFVLANDKNSGLRIDAINAIFNMKVEGINIDDKIVNELNKRVETDNNTYIRNRAESLLKEVN